MSFVPVNPRPFLQDLVNKDVVVRLKWGETEYKGRLVVRFFSIFSTLFPAGSVGQRDMYRRMKMEDRS